MSEQCYLHRGVCHWEGNEGTAPANLGWFALLDWAVYHAPGYGLWQTFRVSLIGQPMLKRADRVAKWWDDSVDGDLPPEESLADIVRCVNVLRSLRGQFSAHPELRDLLDILNPELEKRWNRSPARR